MRHVETRLSDVGKDSFTLSLKVVRFERTHKVLHTTGRLGVDVSAIEGNVTGADEPVECVHDDVVKGKDARNDSVAREGTYCGV